MADPDVLIRQLQERFQRGKGAPPAPAGFALGTEWTDVTTGEKYLLVVAGWKLITHA